MKQLLYYKPDKSDSCRDDVTICVLFTNSGKKKPLRCKTKINSNLIQYFRRLAFINKINPPSENVSSLTTLRRQAGHCIHQFFWASPSRVFLPEGDREWKAWCFNLLHEGNRAVPEISRNQFGSGKLRFLNC